MLFQKRVVHTQLDIYVLLHYSINNAVDLVIAYIMCPVRNHVQSLPQTCNEMLT